MPTLVHLADERNSKKIRKGGLTPGKYSRGVYCMPVLPDFYVCHQWLRELKRSGVKTFVGVYFKMDSTELVYAGRYNHEHKLIALGEAIKEIMTLEDPLGYEWIVMRKITAPQITAIKRLPQTMGWRYQPGANGKRPCSCDYCIKGTIKAASIRRRFNPSEERKSYTTLLGKLAQSSGEEEVETLLYAIQAKSRRANPEALLHLLDRYSSSVNQLLAATLGYYKHKKTIGILLGLLSHTDPEVRDSSAESIVKLKSREGLGLLLRYSDDPVVERVIAGHQFTLEANGA